MAFSLGYSTLLISLPLVLVFANHVYTTEGHYSKVSAEVVESICQKTIDSSFCLRTLRSHLHTATNLPQLTKLTIDAANTHAVATLRKIKSAIQKAVDPKKKEGYVACSKDYADAISALRDASRDVARGLYGDVKNNAQNAIEEARSCASKKPVDDKSLNERNDNLEQHSSVIIALANKLQKERVTRKRY